MTNPLGPAGVVTGTQAGASALTIFAAPATGDEFNTVGERLVPKGCFKVEDLLFDFGSSFIRPEMKDELPKLAQLRNENKVGTVFPPMSVFGHADPVGDIDLNKVLSGRRAIALYAMLVRDVDMWESLFTPPVHDDNWGTKSIQTMLSSVQEPIEVDGVAGENTRAAVRTFQKAKGLTVDGNAGSGTRKVLYRAYMDLLCGPQLLLDKKTDFLGANQDGAGGKGDFQGCSEFNPLRVFSTSETAAFAKTSDHTKRNEQNAPNRRVLVMLFAPGRRVNPNVWPCPRAKEGVAACKKRFFPDAELRRNPQANRREFDDTKDTFACRFYQIISDDSPCERVRPLPPLPIPPIPPIPPLPLTNVNPLILFAISDLTVTADDAAGSRSSFASAVAPTVGAVTPLKDIVLVKKPYTNPRRVEVVLKTDTPFDGTGTLTVNDPNSIVLFRTSSGGAPIQFNGPPITFTGAQLNPTGPGVSLFAEGRVASANMRDFAMTLRLSGGTQRRGPDAVARMTCIELVLDIGAPRVNATTAPVPLPQAPAVTPATPADKFFLGRPIPIQDAARIQERAMLIVQPVTTRGFAALNKRLVLVKIGRNASTFAQEAPSTSASAPDVVIPPRHTFVSTNTPTTFFVEGTSESTNPRDNSYQLGIDGLEGDGDRVSITVVLAEILSNRTRASVRTVAIAPERPAPVSAQTAFFTAPRIIGRNFPIELRTFIPTAAATAFQWTSQGGAALTLTDATTQVLKLTATTRSVTENDTLIQVRVTSNVGVFVRRHRLTCVEVTIDPVSANHPFTSASPVNSIVNPAAVVILTAADANDAAKVAKIEMIRFGQSTPGAAGAAPVVVADAIGIQPNLTFTDDDDRLAWWIIGNDGNEYRGRADFRAGEPARRGTKIEVVGVAEGDVLIQPYSGGFGYGMFRASVLPLRQIKYRINRVFTAAGRPGKPGRAASVPTRSHLDGERHIAVANIFLRQIGIQLIPDNSIQMAAPRPGNSQIGLAGLDRFVVAVTQGVGATAGTTVAGGFDVEINDSGMVFRASDFRSGQAIQINARNEIITFAYVESLAGNRAVAQSNFIPTNHTPGGALRETGTPSSSLIRRSGIPDQTPVSPVRMVVIRSFGVGAQPPTPANGARNVNLLWGIVVPTAFADTLAAPLGMTQDLLYGSTLAHEVGHVLGLEHRNPTEDGIRTPRDKNLLFSGTTVNMESLDIVQCKAIRNSEVLRRNP